MRDLVAQVVARVRRPMGSTAVVLLSLAVAISATTAMTKPTDAFFADPGAAHTSVGSPAAVPLAFTEISAGQNYTLALRDNGRLYSWGANFIGQLGDGTTESRSEPVEVALPKGARVTSFSAGARVAMALTDDGTVYVWGDPEPGATPTPQPVSGAWGTPVGVAAGGVYFMVWNTAGELYSWGVNGSGRLGRGQINVTDFTPRKVTAAGASGIVGADGGRYGGIAWRASGTVYAWGSRMGEVAGKTLGGVPAGTIRKADLGYDVNLLLMDSGRVYTSIAGGGYSHQANLPAGIVDVSASFADEHNSQTYLALTSGGAPWGWFENGNGQLGTGSTSADTAMHALSLTTADSPTITRVASSDRHSVLLTSTGGYIASGANNQGHLGNGTTVADTRYRPAIVRYVWP